MQKMCLVLVPYCFVVLYGLSTFSFKSIGDFLFVFVCIFLIIISFLSTHVYMIYLCFVNGQKHVFCWFFPIHFETWHLFFKVYTDIYRVIYLQPSDRSMRACSCVGVLADVRIHITPCLGHLGENRTSWESVGHATYHERVYWRVQTGPWMEVGRWDTGPGERRRWRGVGWQVTNWNTKTYTQCSYVKWILE